METEGGRRIKTKTLTAHPPLPHPTPLACSKSLSRRPAWTASCRPCWQTGAAPWRKPW